MPVLDREGDIVGDTPSVQSAVNAPVTLTLPAPGERFRWLVTGFALSASAVAAAAVTFTLISNLTTLDQIEVPGGAGALPLQLVSDRRYRGEVNQPVVATLPALGAAVRGTVALNAQRVPA